MIEQIAVESVRGSVEQVHRKVDYAARAIHCEYNRGILIAMNTRRNAVGTLWDNGTHYHFMVYIMPKEGECEVILSSLPEESYIRQAKLRKRETEQFLDALRR